MRPADLTAWVASTTAETAVDVRHIANGYSRATYDITCASGRRLVARVDSARSPMRDTELSLDREVIAHQALVGTEVPRAPLLAHAEGAMLFERMPGTHLLDQLSGAQRRAVVGDFMDRLGGLHALRLDDLELPEAVRAEAAADPLGGDLDRWLGAVHRRARRPWPLLDLAFRLLRENAPGSDSVAPSLLHGDVGPGNFLHENGKVTALLDWEFWHVGDPSDDLAWWIWRAHERFPSADADLSAEFGRWARRTGRVVDGPRIDYYQTVVRLRSLVVAAIAVDNRTPGVDHSVLLPVVWSLSYQIARDVLHLLGQDLEVDETPATTAGAALAAEALSFLRRDVTDILVPDAGTDTARRQAAAVLTYVEHLQAVTSIGSAVAAADESDLRGARLDGFHASAAPVQGEDALRSLAALGRIAHRHLRLWPTAFARMPIKPIRVAELELQAYVEPPVAGRV